MSVSSDVEAKPRPASRVGAAVLAPLPQALVTPLLAFADHVVSLEADYIIFMARKALRLHDLLITAGCRVPTAPVIADHVLDQNLSALTGKRVALVDDTVILGSTLRSAREKLAAAGVTDIQTVVFAVDGDNWVRDASPVDKYFATLTEAEMLVFCASEVEALALAGIPYLSDFPISKRVRLTRAQFHTLYSIPGWDSFLLSSARQEREQVFFHTHVPKREGKELLRQVAGELGVVTDITKVRSFSFTTKEARLTRVVPIVTLQPLAEARINEAFEAVLRQGAAFTDSNRRRLRYYLVSSQAKLRLVQYFLSVLMGEHYLAALSEALSRPRLANFDLTEASRLFGPWLRRELAAVHASAVELCRDGAQALTFVAPIAPAPLPAEVEDLARRESTRFRRVAASERLRDDQPRNAFAELVRVFIDLHTNRELPARRAARANGGVIPPEYSDRLQLGYSWHNLAEFLGWRDRRQVKPNRSTRLSLMLDALIDLGIAVPILCIRDGVAFRAYRHGEDAPYVAQEQALAYEAAAGFLDANGREDIPRLTLEKLLVALMRVGWARGFLTPFYGLNGAERIARIGFHRHGAVTTWSDAPSIFADSQDAWLSRHLVNVGVLRRNGREHYALGEPPQAAFLSSDARAQARELGMLIGAMARRPGSGSPPVLDERRLTLLTTCHLPSDAAGSVVAELKIFSRWFEDNEQRLRGHRIEADVGHRQALMRLTQSSGYNAFNSARLKLSGFWSGAPAAIAEEAAQSLDDGTIGGRIAAGRWRSSWQAVRDGAADDLKDVFGKIIAKLGGEFMPIAIGLFTLELVLASRLLATSRIRPKEYGRICDKAVSWLDAISPHAQDLHGLRRHVERLREHCVKRLPMEDLTKAWTYGLDLIARAQASARSSEHHASHLVRDYGHMKRRTDYMYALWYDIINSTGQKSNLRPAELDAYRGRVSDFKKAVNTGLLTLGRTAAARGAYLSLATATVRSEDDEKTIFLGGPGGRDWLRQATQLVIKLADDQEICVRALAMNADFAGDVPHQYDGDPQVIGPAFWEYGSRVKKEAAAQESAHGIGNAPRSILWLADELAETHEDFDFVTFEAPVTLTSRNTIQSRTVETRLFGGAVVLGSFRT